MEAKMKQFRNLIVLLMLLLTSNRLFAQTITSPVQDYLSRGNDDRDLLVPNMHDIWKLEIDINGDGKNEILVSTTGYGDRQGNLWTVYLPISEGYKRQESEVKFRKDYYTIADLGAGRCLLVYTPAKGGGTFTSYKVQTGSVSGTEVSHVGSSENPGDPGNILFQKYFEPPKEDQKGILTVTPMAGLTTQGFQIPPTKSDPAATP